MTSLLAFLVAVVVFCGYLLYDLHRANQKRKQFMRARIAPDGTNLAQDVSDRSIGLTVEPSAAAQKLLAFMHGLGVDVEAASKKLDRKLAQAGIENPDAAAWYLFYQRFGAMAMVALAAVLALSAQGRWAMVMVLAALFLAVIGIFGAQLYLKNCIQKRKQVLQRAFPDTLDLLLICVESGLSLDAALARVCNELGRAHPEMMHELNRTRLELNLLNDRVRALMNLGERTDMVAFRSLVASLIQSERFGTSLTDTLRVLSEDFRLLRLADAETRAARIPVLITIPLVMFLLPALLIILLGPAVVKFNTQDNAPIFSDNPKPKQKPTRSR
jgi:tight adherence protein C